MGFLSSLGKLGQRAGSAFMNVVERIGNQQAQFYDQLGLNAENQANTWDWMRSYGGGF